jgi:hypothetical protein
MWQILGGACNTKDDHPANGSPRSSGGPDGLLRLAFGDSL